MPSAPRSAALRALKSELARLERRAPEGQRWGVIPLGLAPVDAALPGGGLARGALHEAWGAGPQAEHATAAALLAGRLLARLPGEVLWVLEQRDLYPPGLVPAGLSPDRVVYVHARKPATVLLVMEEGLQHGGAGGLAGVVGEFSGTLGLTASRRLQLAAGHSGVTAFLLRRSRRFDDPALRQPSAAATRWRIAALPSPPPLPHAPDTPGLGPALWRLDLVRCRGGEPHSWIVEAFDATGRCRLVTDLGDRPAAEASARAIA